MPTPQRARSSAENADLGARLDGWKDIAAYLGKVERTVKRWDVGRGLPTHRVPGGGRASVYAYTRELDEWLKSGKALDADAAADTTTETAADEEQEVELEWVVPRVGGPATGESVPPTLHVLHATAPHRGLTRNWLLTICGLLIAGIAGAAANSPSVRAATERIARLFHGDLAGHPAELRHGESHAASESERKQAHDLYLKGRFEWSQRTPDSLNRALDDFTQAIVHDPGYAQAYVGMADTYDLLREYSTMPDSEAYARAIAAARKAVELDDSLAEAHRALAFAEWWGNWDFVDGEKEFRRAIELNPKDPVARKWYANVLAVQGRFPESLEENDKAQELDPTSHSILADRGLMLFDAGRKYEGIALIKEVERSAPEFLSPHYYLMTISLELRDYPSYLEEGKKTAEAENDPVLKDTIAAARAGYERDGERGLLNDLYARQREYYEAGKLSGTMVAETCILMGKKQEALQLLEEAYNRHESHVLACLSEPDLLTLRDEPKYKALVKKINFPREPQMAQPSTFPAEDQLSFRDAPDPH
jgi:tetratricopeptide (TPR) repeat protein